MPDHALSPLPVLFVLLALATACAGPGPDAGEADTYALEGSGPELYERVLVPPLFAPWAEDLVAHTELEPGDRVLDVACGTGVVARRAAEVVGPEGAVVGLDINPAMLAVARTTPPGNGAAIEWREGDACDLPFDAGSFDAVLCQQGLQFFPDREKAVREMHRVLKPGGKVALSVWRPVEHNPYGAAVADAVGRHVSERAAQETHSPFACDGPEELGRLLSEAGFTSVAATIVDLDMEIASPRPFVRADVAAYPRTGAAIAGWSAGQKKALVDDVLAGLEDFRSPDGWVIPWQACIALGER